jgi:hypothetical protein
LLERENIVADTSENLAKALEMIGTRPYFAVMADMRLRVRTMRMGYRFYALFRINRLMPG